MDVALYARVSKDRQETQNQLRQLRAFAGKQRWKVVAEYVDDGITGSGKALRPQFEAMMAGASKRQFAVVLFWALDRLSREGVLPTLRHLERLDHYGVAWRSFTEQYLDSTGPFRDAVISILAALAKQERIVISERTKAGLQHARANGKTLGRPRAQVPITKVRQAQAKGASLRSLATKYNVSASYLCRALKT